MRLVVQENTPLVLAWVEGGLASLTKRRLKRGVFVSVVDRQVAINRFVVEHNTRPKPILTKLSEPSPRLPSVRFYPRSRHSDNGRFDAVSNVPQIQSDVGDLRWQMDASPLWRGVSGQIWRRERGVRFSSETTVPGRGAEENTTVQKALTSAPSRYVVQADPALRYCAFRFFIYFSPVRWARRLLREG